LAVLSLAIHPNAQILAGAYYTIFRSSDNGLNWTAVYTDSRPSFRITSFAFNVNGHIFAGANANDGSLSTKFGDILRSTDSGESWQPVSAGLPFNRNIDCLAINSRGQIFAGMEGIFPSAKGIFRSTDNGETWTQVNPDAKPISLVINTKGHIFAGAVGDIHDQRISEVLRSVDNGDTWVPVNAGLSNSHIFALAINADDRLFAGTDGGGVFRSIFSTTSVKDKIAKSPTAFVLKQNYPNPFNPSTTIQFSLPRSGYVTLKVYDMLGAEVATLVAENLFAGKHQVEWNAGALTGGVYFYRLQQAGGAIQTKKLILVKR
jgi:photosystem II stability/assembly factor-like uncharacterized protein